MTRRGTHKKSASDDDKRRSLPFGGDGRLSIPGGRRAGRGLSRVAAALLATLMLLSFAACDKGDAGTSGEVGGTTATEAATEVAATSSTASGHLEVIDFGGETVSVAYRGGPDAMEIYAEMLNGEIVNDYVYERNLVIEARLGVKLEFVSYGSATTAEIPSAMISSVLAGDCEHDVIAWSQYRMLPLAVKGFFYDVQDTEYLHFDKPWWNNEYMDEVNLHAGKRFFLMGDISLGAIRKTGAVFYNKALYEGLTHEKDGLYREVKEGKWTIERMAQLSRDVFSDLNSNGSADVGIDILGCAASTVANTEMFAYAAGFRVFRWDESGVPVFVAEEEQNGNIIARLQNLYHHCEGFAPTVNDTYVFNSDSLTQDFLAGRLLFMASWLMSCEQLQGEKNCGIIPYPKYDEEQERYLSLIQDTATVFGVPASCRREDMVSAVLEVWCHENYRRVFPGYYEMALKLKYSSDEISSQMIDLIHDGAVTDVGYAYNYALASVGTVMRPVMASDANIYASRIKALKKMVNRNMDTLIAAFR